MPYLNNLPIMPKEARSNMSYSAASTTAPYPQPNAVAQRNAAIWSTSDDEVLLRARASGLNWQPIASRNFPNKTANACRKRHERLIERRHVDDWDNQKLELLAQEYLACRKEMWEMLAARLGERWSVVEAKVSANEPLTTNRSRLTPNPSVWKRVSSSSKAPLALHSAKPRPTTMPRPIASKTEVFLTTTATPALCYVPVPSLIWRPQTKSATAFLSPCPDTAPAPRGPSPTTDNRSVCTKSICAQGAYRFHYLNTSHQCRCREPEKLTVTLLLRGHLPLRT
jgi:hypothetical protein